MRTFELSDCRFGRLVAVKAVVHNGKRMWLCECDCGNVSVIAASSLVKGKTRSCGCLRKEILVERNKKHGMAYSRTYTSWCRMKSRCANQIDPKYPLYGGRGISVCSEWAASFAQFLSDMGEAPEGLSLDRLDTNGDYWPGNCRWATPQEQANNRRQHIWVDVNGVRMTLAEAARATGRNYGTLRSRYRRGSPIASGIKLLSSS